MRKLNLNIDYDEIFLPVFKPLQDPGIRLKFSYGGRDSGKSRDRAMDLIIACLSKKYFRCILIKKTYASIKDSQFQLIKDICEEWKIDHLFNFVEKPMEIRCKVNKNKFICRGMDKPEKIKSINNPSDAWVEEGNQLTQKDWIYIVTTLRSDKGPVNICMTFNTETAGPYEDFWLYKEYFVHAQGLKSFTSEKRIKVKDKEIVLPYIAIHSTYHDNPYCNDERIAWHENLQSMNLYWYNVFTMGEWGNEENDQPWLFTFNKERHVSKIELFAKRSEILYLSFDFNRNPHACSVMQWYEETLWIIQVFKIPNVGTEGICDLVKSMYPGYLYMITGDYSGDTPSSIFKEQVTNYSMIRAILLLTDGQIKIMPNPLLKNNQTLVNDIFHNYRVQICPMKARAAVYDCENVKRLPDGNIEKKNRKDPKQQADVLDTIRYWCNMFMGWFTGWNKS